MDVKEFEAMTGGAGVVWTEERHGSFLSWLEECFVRRMLGWEDEDGGRLGLRRPPLDRYVPDSATESTRDCKKAKPRSAEATREAPAAAKRGGARDLRKRDVVESWDPSKSKSKTR